jgi:Mg2+-importing ATPase
MPLTFAIPFLPFASWLGFEPLPAPLLAMIAVLTALYVLAAELAKLRFYRRVA